MSSQESANSRSSLQGGLASLARQYTQFCLVGATSTLVNFLCVFTQLKILGVTIDDLADRFWLRNIVLGSAFIVSAVNGYTWNRLWTFKSKNRNIVRQWAQFAVVGGIGTMIYLGVVNLFLLDAVIRVFLDSSLFPILKHLRSKPGMTEHQIANALVGLFGVVAGIIVASLWNFLANKHWTFRDSGGVSESE